MNKNWKRLFSVALLALGLNQAFAFSWNGLGSGFAQAPVQWAKQIRTIGYYPCYPMREEFKPGSVLMFSATLPGFSYYYGQGALYKGWPIPILGPIPPLAPVWGALSRYTRDGFGHPKPEVMYLGDLDYTDKLEQLMAQEKVTTPSAKVAEAYIQYDTGVDKL
jgi:hypothetical protein